MLDKNFEPFLRDFILREGVARLLPRRMGLLKDYARNEYNAEIRLLDKAIQFNALNTIKKASAKDIESTAYSLITTLKSSLQPIAEADAFEIIALLCSVLSNYALPDRTGIVTDDIAATLDLMENTHENLFITGKAGTGKSTLIRKFRQRFAKKHNKRIKIVAPTGLAALNCDGVTMHAFFGLPFDILSPEVIEDNWAKSQYPQPHRTRFSELDVIVIDEISMVRMDTLDAIDYILRRKRNNNQPFGGIQMIIVGDLFQLPPIISEQKKIVSGTDKISETEYFTEKYGENKRYFFDAESYQNGKFRNVELRKVFRQRDATFVNLLNSIRDGSINDRDIDIFNRHCHQPEYDVDISDGRVVLCGHTEAVNEINRHQMAQLPTSEYVYLAENNNWPKDINFPADEKLVLKEGATVMMTKNKRNCWVNGDIGTIKYLTSNSIVVTVNGDDYPVEKATHTWKELIYDRKTQKITGSRTIGQFKQYPIKLSWACTIHKSQGRTFDKVVIDLEHGAFAHGQTYVALSRCTSLDGIILRQPLRKEDLMVDSRIVEFHNNHVNMNTGHSNMFK